jgi:hypothetical protein
VDTFYYDAIEEMLKGAAYGYSRDINTLGGQFSVLIAVAWRKVCVTKGTESGDRRTIPGSAIALVEVCDGLETIGVFPLIFDHKIPGINSLRKDEDRESSIQYVSGFFSRKQNLCLRFRVGDETSRMGLEWSIQQHDGRPWLSVSLSGSMEDWGAPMFPPEGEEWVETFMCLYKKVRDVDPEALMK